MVCLLSSIIANLSAYIYHEIKHDIEPIDNTNNLMVKFS